MSFTRGIADGQLIGRAMRAESGAASANAAADDAIRLARGEAEKAATAESNAQRWRKEALRLNSLLKDANGATSAGRIVMNAMIKILDEMSPAERAQMKERLVNLSRARIILRDNEMRNTPDFLDIESQMRELPENKILGIV